MSWSNVYGQRSDCYGIYCPLHNDWSVVLFLIGGGVYLAVKFGLPLGRLPGDIRIEGENGSFYFPITTSILVSVVLTIVLNVISRFLQK